jgi:hypothetical protein
MYAMAVPNSKLIVLNPVIIIDQKTMRKAELIFAQINALSQRRRSASVPHVTQRQRGDFSTCNLQDRWRSGPINPCSRLILLEIGSVLSQQMAARGAIVSVTATRPRERR